MEYELGAEISFNSTDLSHGQLSPKAIHMYGPITESSQVSINKPSQREQKDKTDRKIVSKAKSIQIHLKGIEIELKETKLSELRSKVKKIRRTIN